MTTHAREAETRPQLPAESGEAWVGFFIGRATLMVLPAAALTLTLYRQEGLSQADAVILFLILIPAGLIICSWDAAGYWIGLSLACRHPVPARRLRRFGLAVGAATLPAVYIAWCVISAFIGPARSGGTLLVVAIASAIGVGLLTAAAAWYLASTGWLALPPAGDCRACGYDLRGSPAGGDCPECGAGR